VIPAELRETPLGVADIPDALALSAEPGWNQVADDWRLMIEHGDAFGLKEAGGRLVASGLTVPFQGPFAWISMILVTVAYRRCGIATRLMRHCMSALEGRGRTPALDASPEGRTVYLRMGFSDVYATTRMFRASGPPEHAEAPGEAFIRAMTREDLPRVAAYDRVPFGADRAYVLEHLCARLPEVALVAERDGEVVGFILGRNGRTCAQLGPLVAEDPDAALDLLRGALAAVSGPICLDIADHHTSLRRWLDDQGFVPVVPFTRMYLGRDQPYDDPHRIYVIAGPELG
jgi:predicted N-acetyltransferase YhbS